MFMYMKNKIFEKNQNIQGQFIELERYIRL